MCERRINHLVLGLFILAAPCVVRTQTSGTVMEGPFREAYLNGSAHISMLLPRPLSLRGQHIGLSFRSCKGGPLFNQPTRPGVPGLALEARQEGLVLTITSKTRGRQETLLPAPRMLDNRWHTVEIVDRLGNITLSSPGQGEVTVRGDISTPEDNGATVVVLGGDGFEGCILEGPSLVLSGAAGFYQNGVNVQWGPCPMDHSSCHVTDHCYNEPCMRHGTCVSRADRNDYECHCSPRYSGKNCDKDNGPICTRDNTNPCRNGGECQEDNMGNYICVCEPGFSGRHCDIMSSGPQACVNSPCLNNGTCHVLPGGGQECQCPPGFTGSRCENNLDECMSNPCLHGGLCEDLINGYKCQCSRTGYEGVHCENNVDECKHAPCLNQGTCFDTYGSYVCQCAPGFGGQNCEINLDECSSSPCQHGGVCLDLLGGYSCKCQPGYSGENCERMTSDPPPLDVYSDACGGCPSNSICVENSQLTGPSHICVCQPRYLGTPPNCTLGERSLAHHTPCSSVPCAHGGVCRETGPDTYNCSCPAGYSGLQCELPPSPALLQLAPSTLPSHLDSANNCFVRPCLNGGTCIGETLGCKCPDFWSGVFCERHITCSDAPCYNVVSCQDFESGFYCECQKGWSGPTCQHNNNECLPDPCNNGATCIDEVNNYTCVCPPGFSGAQCQHSVDECLSNPCMNGGSCIDRIDGYTCNCTEDYVGERCEREYNACMSQPCQNNGSCVLQPQKSRHSFYCECAPGFEGLLCESNINDCIRVNCPEGRVCVDLVSTYECSCPPGFTGENCTIDIDHCKDAHCDNNGTCKDRVGNYTCICPAGYTGSKCELDVDECKVFDNLCNYGICVNNPGSYQCFCRPGFSGDHCDLDFDECLSRPCLNGAKCENKINGFNCVCTAGYTGKDCSQNINECESNPCMNGSTCIDEIASFSCACPPGITGALCETNINDCESSPCENGGICMDGINSYTCNCAGTGYEGVHCQHNIDDCLAQPCHNGGQCIDEINNYQCDCYAAYTGKNCELDIMDCDVTSCQYGGTCLELSDQDLYLNMSAPYRALLPEHFSYETAAGFVCACVEGTTGQRCEVNIDECQSSPCQHGVCKDLLASYRCDCEKGYEGVHCELDVDECAPQPCAHGRCINGRADYTCECEVGWGGRNCSVELHGCLEENTCHNGGTCLPWLLGETEHRFNCTCPRGFHGRTCRRSTTLSFAGPSSHVTVNTTREEGYDISFRFKTTLSDGLLVAGQGFTIYLLELVGGRLNLHTNLLNKYEGAFIGTKLNDSNWKNVFVSINSSHLVLSATDEQSIYPINESAEGGVPFGGVSARSSSPTSFPITHLGGNKSFFRKSASFVGCMEDVIVNGKWLLPAEEGFEAGMDSEDEGDVAVSQMSGIEAGCPRTEQCVPNPCFNGGLCTDLWSNFKCACERPFLGHTCQYNMTAATFGHENATEGHVTVRVADEARQALRLVASVSMFIRTRQPHGAIFHLGPALGPGAELADDTVIAAQLEAGELHVRIQFNSSLPPESYSVGGTRLDDGNSHLIQVKRDTTLVEVRINGTEYFKKTISSAGPLNAQVLYLGGMPARPAPLLLSSSQPITATVQPSQPMSLDHHMMETPSGVNLPNSAILRARRQAGVISAVQPSALLNTVSIDVLNQGGVSALAVAARPEPYYNDFKGVIQDVQISNDTHVFVVQFFRLVAPDVDIPPSLGEVSFSRDSVLEGVVSDDSCVGEPCYHGGTCRVTWNDFVCDCPAGYKGKRCDEMEFCQLQDCPSGSKCNNLDEGYECIAFATFNGSLSPTPLSYSVKTHDEESPWWGVPELKVTFRTKTGGTLIFISLDHDHLRLSVLNDGTVFADYSFDGENANTKANSIKSNGNWTTALIKLEEGLPILSIINDETLTGARREQPLDPRPQVSMQSWKRLLRKGKVTLAGTEGVTTHDANDIDNGHLIQPIKHSIPYKGCLGEVRVSGILVPFFSAQQLNASNNVTSRHFLTEPFDSTLPHTGCELCFNADCQHGGMCRDPQELYECSCNAGYEGDTCEVDIDECAGNFCQNNSTCIDAVANYTCICPPGFQGWLCDEEIDECASDPCMNNGTCHDLLAKFECVCPEEFEGEQCERLKRVTCENMPCFNQANCADIHNPVTGDNFTCTCTPGYVGPVCALAFCEKTQCMNGGICETYVQPPVCRCPPGFEGALCETDINECLSQPCLNGGQCIDLVAAFSCECVGTGYEGERCEHDINECDEGLRAGFEPCGAGLCINQMGSFQCVCENISFCGQTCSEPNPCLLEPCENGATCTPVCTLETNYTCDCLGEFTGHHCDIPIELAPRGDDGPNLALIITPIVCLLVLVAAVGVAVFISLARKKRATRGTYSPSQQEYCNPRVELDNVLKPPPEERLI